MKIILASASPRRRELLRLITDDFTAVSTDANEALPKNIPAENAAEYLSYVKANAAAALFPEDIIIGCDTTVICGSSILGKPPSKDQCREFISLLSGKSHTVITGCTLICGSLRKSFSTATSVTFRKLSQEEIEGYISTDEPYDKAGGYAVQGKGALLIEKIDGDYFNVVGLPVSTLNIELKKFIKEITMKNTAFQPANILIPKKSADMSKWAVVACDQYTGEPEYWNSVYEAVGSEPSSQNLILPEIYLEDSNVQERIDNIHSAMNSYLSSDFFDEYRDAMIYVRRTQSNGILRQGIIGKIDLEKYDFSKGSSSEVRATEATVIERIPPRIRVRQNAPLELPHIMILIDDPENTVIEPLADMQLEQLYDTELMQGGGSISGYLVSSEQQEKINSALCRLADADSFNKKYGLENSPVLLFAMGDGNHSLTTAKEFYEQLKKANPDKDLSNHPARYALAEIVNLHSPALEFEAIHRLVYDTDCEKLIADMKNALMLSDGSGEQSFTYIYGSSSRTASIGRESSNLTVGSLQNFLDSWLRENGGKVDYIHGADTVKALAERHGGIAFILPDMDKSELFPTVIKDGVLPRKTFSMGHAADKRYYIEARKITE